MTAHLHVSFVVRADFLDPDVVFGVDKWLCSAVGLSDSHHACDVLEVTNIVHLDLQRNMQKPFSEAVYAQVFIHVKDDEACRNLLIFTAFLALA